MLHEHALRAFEVQEALISAIDARLAGMSWPDIARSAELRAFVAELDRRTPFAGALGLVDPAGRIVVSSRAPDGQGLPVDVSSREYVRDFPAGSAGTFIGEVVVTRPSGLVAFPFARARQAGVGQGDGLIVGTYQSEAFEHFYASVAESPGDVISLLRLDGRMLARFPVREDRRTGQGSGGALLRQAREEGASRLLQYARSPVDGVDRLYGLRRIGTYPVVVLYGLDPAVMRSAWLRRLGVLGAVCAGSALLLLVLTEAVRRATRRAGTALAAAADEAEAARREAEHRAGAEQRMRHAERSAALGQIAAGVAHDMNNLVQGVLAAGRLLERRAGQPDEVRRLAAMLGDAAGRGQRLAHRMLEFSRPASSAEARFPPAETLAGVQELMGGLLGSGVRLELRVAPGLPDAAADRRDFETVLVNLAVNARDAMPGGGIVRIEADRVGEGPPGLARPGPWLRVAVIDAGEGMPPEVLARVGDPFFTTKPRGQGTGLGLMMAKQFAERAGGALTVESERGRGTEVTLWLPLAVEMANAE